MLTLTPSLQLSPRAPAAGEYGIAEHLNAAIPHLMLSLQTSGGLIEIGAFPNFEKILLWIKEDTERKEKLRKLEAEIKPSSNWKPRTMDSYIKNLCIK